MVCKYTTNAGETGGSRTSVQLGSFQQGPMRACHELWLAGPGCSHLWDWEGGHLGALAKKVWSGGYPNDSFLTTWTIDVVGVGVEKMGGRRRDF